MEQLFGSSLQTSSGNKPTAELLKDKVVGIYFSAHWCPPCRGFTPDLISSYSKHLKEKGIEIIFVSSDRDEKAFDDYFKDMPWLALPYADRDRKNALSKKFKVQGIPSFVILDKDASLITLDGREKISQDAEGADFPWKPQPLSALLKFDVENEGKTMSLDEYAKDKVLALYFSAHWCPPCRGYTPKLAEKYKEIKAAGLPFEVVFVSSDRDEAAYDGYCKEHPWGAMPYKDRKLKEQLSSRFGVSGIPSLVLLDKDRSVITTNGRGAVMGDLKDFPFHPKPVSDLAADAEGINETTSVIVLAESCAKPDQEAAYAALEELAKEYKAKAKASGDDAEFCFFIAYSSEGPVPRVRQLCKLKEAAAAASAPPAVGGTGYAAGAEKMAGAELILLDIPDNGGYYKGEASQISADGLRKFLADYKDKKLERQQLG